jgi:hypothetical protein
MVLPSSRACRASEFTTSPAQLTTQAFPICRTRVTRGRLEHAQPDLGAVVCVQTFRDEYRQKDLGLSQLFDDT